MQKGGNDHLWPIPEVGVKDTSIQRMAMVKEAKPLTVFHIGIYTYSFIK
jgi:hypothetical protein